MNLGLCKLFFYSLECYFLKINLYICVSANDITLTNTYEYEKVLFLYHAGSGAACGNRT